MSLELFAGRFSRSDGGGGSGPPRTTADMKPDVCSESMSVRMRFVDGTEVRPRRAREAFWRCEQTWERVTRDIVSRILLRDVL